MPEQGSSGSRRVPDPARADPAAEANAIERAAERLYRATRPRYVHVLLGLVVVSIQLVIVPAFVALFMPLWDARVDEYPRALLTIEVATLVGGTPGLLYLGLRHHRALVDYLRGDPDVRPVDVWDSSVGDLPRAVTEIAVWYMAWVAAAQITLGAHFGFSPVAQALAITATAFLVLGVGVFQYLFFEIALRPVVREIAPALPRGLSETRPGLSLARKLLVLLPAMSLFNGAAVGAVVSNSLALEEQLAVMVAAAFAVSATMALVLAIMVRHSLLAPLDELRRALGRVRSGEAEIRLPPLGGQEFDEVGHAFNDMVERLARSDAEMRDSRSRIVTAADAERARIERDLHDGAQQHLVLLQLKLGMLGKALADDSPTRTLVEDARASLTDALVDLRNLAHGIYPSVLENEGIVAALAAAAERATIPTQVVADSLERQPREIEAAVYFCCLEALQNASKHAGDGATATVSVGAQNGTVEFTVADTGVGFDGPVGGHGIQNMQDRVGALSGDLQISSSVGGGTRVSGSIPLTLRR